MADPVAGKSGFLCTYMSSHPDTLVAYVKHFGKVDGNVSSAKMLSIDSKVRTTTPFSQPVRPSDLLCKARGWMRAISLSYINAPTGNGLGVQDQRFGCQAAGRARRVRPPANRLRGS
jgi:hypothetical protein